MHPITSEFKNLSEEKSHDDRTNGAQEELKAAGIRVVTIQPGDSDRAKAMSVMENILQSNADIKAVFVTNEERP
ncbi:hypothetical protein ABEX47_27375 [Paenibacillus ehimensis]|uniref:hypothetical protein n=1 Tax=Paenibacillus ehimensis TaxID=79264 RepID=UPI003D288533